MSAIFGDLPRKPLASGQVAQNRLNKMQAEIAMREYEEGETALRAGIEQKYKVTFEEDEGGWRVDDQQVQGEYDVEQFTLDQMRTYEMYRSVAAKLIERMDTTSQLLARFHGKPALDLKVVRFKKL